MAKNLESEEPKLKPVFAHGIFVVTEESGVAQTLIYEYIDETSYYWSIIELGDMARLKQEKDLLKRNMQELLEEEEIVFNGVKVKPRVFDVKISAPLPTSVSFTFLIGFPAPIRKGENVYQNFYEPEVVEYDYNVVWYLPSHVLDVKANFGVPYTLVNNHIILFSVKRGTRTPGYEEIRFKM